MIFRVGKDGLNGCIPAGYSGFCPSGSLGCGIFSSAPPSALNGILFEQIP
jgi:hypothetical protein